MLVFLSNSKQFKLMWTCQKDYDQDSDCCFAGSMHLLGPKAHHCHSQNHHQSQRYLLCPLSLRHRCQQQLLFPRPCWCRQSQVHFFPGTTFNLFSCALASAVCRPLICWRCPMKASETEVHVAWSSSSRPCGSLDRTGCGLMGWMPVLRKPDTTLASIFSDKESKSCPRRLGKLSFWMLWDFVPKEFL